MYEKKDENLPTLTVVTAAYNQGIFLRDTIESVLSQDYPNIEFVVLDDGSTDETPQILAEYGDRFQWESQENMGQTPTISKGWAMTSGEIITWLNSDDTFYDSGSVRIGMEYLMERPDVGVVFGDSMYTRADGTEIGPTRPIVNFTYKKMVVTCENFISQPSSFIRREVLKIAGGLDPKYYYFMDWDFWLRVGIFYKIEHIDEILSTYRLHSDSKTVAQQKRVAPELEYMYKKYFDRNDVPDEIRALERQAMMNMCFTTGGYYNRGGDTKCASEMGTKAFDYYPRGKYNLANLRKYLYCKFGNSPLYRTGRGLLRGRRSDAS